MADAFSWSPRQFPSNSETWYQYWILLEHGWDVSLEQSHQERDPQTAGDQVEEGWLSGLEDVHHCDGGAQAKDVGYEPSVEVETRLASGEAVGGGGRKVGGEGGRGGKEVR